MIDEAIERYLQGGPGNKNVAGKLYFAVLPVLFLILLQAINHLHANSELIAILVCYS